MRTVNLLNLGAGVQSTTVYLGVASGAFPYPVDYAIFADTGDEPSPVYRHLEWMRSIPGPPILVGSKGNLGDNLTRGVDSTGQRFVSIPAFTAPEGATRASGMIRRQCTQEYKISVIQKVLRAEILSLRPRQWIPKDVHVVQYYGISADEAGRATKISARTESIKWLTVKFPLIEMGMTRQDCKAWLLAYGNVPHEVPRSSCVYCPFHKDEEWMWLKANDPEGWLRAVEIDEALRKAGNIINRGLDHKMYLHRKVKPLVEIEFSPSPMELGMEVLECDGMCGA